MTSLFTLPKRIRSQKSPDVCGSDMNNPNGELFFS